MNDKHAFKYLNEGLALSQTLMGIDDYASKAISQRVSRNPTIADLSFGEPAFGPPEHLIADIESKDLSLVTFLETSKHYETSRGNLTLRRAIADWYRLRYDFAVCPETEIMITNGGVEAITLALLATTEVGDQVAITDPSYMLYSRAIRALGRVVTSLVRPSGPTEYLEMLDGRNRLSGVKALIVNSPENPTGYMLADEEWERLGTVTAKSRTWVIHDEVYDVMAFDRRHRPAGSYGALGEHAIIVNSLSKKFGLPGLRIGWLVAPAPLINLAAKAHDYLYLSVNIQSEMIALRMLVDEKSPAWLDHISNELEHRCRTALNQLGEDSGFEWPRQPLGGMFVFPKVSILYDRIPPCFRDAGPAVCDAVARYLLEVRNVAVVPGSVYGQQGECHVRLVLCTSPDVFETALSRLRKRDL